MLVQARRERMPGWASRSTRLASSFAPLHLQEESVIRLPRQGQGGEADLPTSVPNQCRENHRMRFSGKHGANSQLRILPYSTPSATGPSSGIERASTAGTINNCSLKAGMPGSSRARSASTAAICPPADKPPIETREGSMLRLLALAKTHLSAAQLSHTLAGWGCSGARR